MGAIPVFLMTALWGFVGIAMPILAPKGPHHRWVKLLYFCFFNFFEGKLYFFNQKIYFQHREVRLDVNSCVLLAIVSIFKSNLPLKLKLSLILYFGFLFASQLFSWLCCFMAQMNPLIGPRLHQGTILMIAREWGNIPADIRNYVPRNTSVLE